MIDLKAFDPDVHRTMTGQPNEPVLDSIRLLADLGRLYEVRLLIVPGMNDDDATVARTAAWLHGVDPAMRIKVIGFRCHGVRPTSRPLTEPSTERLAAVEQRLHEAGLRQTCVV
jgi:pyruvate formate lyase activating enzyme